VGSKSTTSTNRPGNHHTINNQTISAATTVTTPVARGPTNMAARGPTRASTNTALVGPPTSRSATPSNEPESGGTRPDLADSHLVAADNFGQ
jgi:hypothetical protein